VVRIGLTKPRVRLVWVVAPELLMIDGLDMLTRPLNAGLPAHYDPLCLYIAESPCQIPSQDCCRTRLVGYSLTGTRSITERVAERAVAVVLSGVLDDGAVGAALIDRAGGHVLVQDPDEAEFGGMPG
jgi:CheB methylesterase